MDSTADSIYLGRIIRAFEPGLHHILQRVVAHFENDIFSNLATVYQAVEE